MRSFNQVQLLGNLGRDAESRFTQGGTQFARFSIATSRSWKDKATGERKEAVDWHNVVLWKCEGLVPYLLKGTAVFVQGRLQTRSWEDQDGQQRQITEIVADQVILVGSPKHAGSRDDAPVSAPRGYQAGPEPAFGSGPDDGDVPF
jgi:single-strand DNA-binding protein